MENNKLIFQTQRHTQIYWGSKGDRVNSRLSDYKLWTEKHMENTRVIRGSEIDSDHKLLESKFKFLTQSKHSYKKTDKTIYKKSAAFKLNLLEQKSIRSSCIKP
jgi:hypothetical protein